MLNPQAVITSVLSCAPQFVLRRFSSVLTGIIAAYAVLLLFLGHPPFFQRVGQLLFIIVLGYWSARGARYSIARLVQLIEGATPESAGAAAGAAPKDASSPSSSLGATSSPTSQAATGRCPSRGLD
ncbi:hypothetical protein LSCM1_04233 [Leishmania martiniquensis]|uniref:Uncharacterized protein n=1 Tax=Leishmania martiniquensis TaxID=1580590 RepID=A0A836GMI5_9TRYP|nr:hypothetical protein LSCM1_04233 [Leishmania martiniquensis]